MTATDRPEQSPSPSARDSDQPTGTGGSSQPARTGPRAAAGDPSGEHPSRATEHVHLRIPLEHPEIPSECVWAVPLGRGRFRIANVPFLVHHVGLGDVVVAVEVEPGALELVEVVEHVHVASFSFELPRSADPRDLLERAGAIGIATEGMGRRLFASSAHRHDAAERFEQMLEDEAEWFERFAPDGRLLRQFGDALLEP